MSKTFRISVYVWGTSNYQTEGGLQVRYFRTDASDPVWAIERFICSEGLMELAAWRYDRWREAHRKMEPWMSPCSLGRRDLWRTPLKLERSSIYDGEYLHRGRVRVFVEEIQIQS